MMYQDEEGKEYCLSNPPIAYYGNSSLFITIHGFDCGIDRIMCVRTPRYNLS